MKILLDTCVAIWCLGGGDELTAEELCMVEDKSNRVFVSIASAWEIEIARLKGKLRLPDEWKDKIVEAEFERLPITPQHTEGLRTLPDIHKDPFDRMIVSQAKCEDMKILTHDGKMKKYFLNLNNQ